MYILTNYTDTKYTVLDTTDMLYEELPKDKVNKHILSTGTIIRHIDKNLNITLNRDKESYIKISDSCVLYHKNSSYFEIITKGNIYSIELPKLKQGYFYKISKLKTHKLNNISVLTIYLGVVSNNNYYEVEPLNIYFMDTIKTNLDSIYNSHKNFIT